MENPVESVTIARFVEELLKGGGTVHAVALTGGEPLEQPDFLKTLIEDIRHLGLPIYLETNGLSEEGAKELAGYVDIVAMDIKLPSLCGGVKLFEIYERTIPIFRSNELFFKIILTDDYLPVEFNEAVELVSALSDGSALVIQPASSTDGSLMVSTLTLLECYKVASRIIKDVRIIPQIHKLLGIR